MGIAGDGARTGTKHNVSYIDARLIGSLHVAVEFVEIDVFTNPPFSGRDYEAG